MRSIGLVLVLLIVGSGFVALAYGLARNVKNLAQPIAFNHTVHIDDAGLACLDCHTDAERSIHAGLPSKKICLDCHDADEEQGVHTEKDKLFAFHDIDEDIPWLRVALTEPDVYFSHRRHVSSGNLDCLICHPDQPKLDKPPAAARLVMTMTDCIECHKESRASSDCLACHR